ncbi:MAG TPA: hypothetical protein VJS63_01185 [Bradyrhizobium sp.]|nr:hypothetical protein [Bradyrhizobium sp.]
MSRRLSPQLEERIPNAWKNPAAGAQDRVRHRGKERSDDAVQDATGRKPACFRPGLRSQAA